MDNPYKNLDFQKIISSLPPEVVQLFQEKEDLQNERDFENLRNCLQNNECYLCHNSIDHIEEDTPCFHWLLNPTIKKKQLKKLFNSGIGFGRTYAYLTWVANADKPIVNINDCSHDTLPNKYIETTIKYKQFEWSFSMGNTDIVGHENSKSSNFPHYHIQIKVDDKVIVKFNDFHIPLTDSDLFALEMENKNVLIPSIHFSSGLDVLSHIDGKELSQYLSPSKNLSEAQYFTRTLIYPATVNESILNKIKELRLLNNWTVPKTIEYINETLHYHIRYEVIHMPINPAEKAHRT